MELVPLDPLYVIQRLSQPPFVKIQGVDNVRELGSYPTTHTGQLTKPRFIYRSAELASITDDGTYHSGHNHMRFMNNESFLP